MHALFDACLQGQGIEMIMLIGGLHVKIFDTYATQCGVKVVPFDIGIYLHAEKSSRDLLRKLQRLWVKVRHIGL